MITSDVTIPAGGSSMPAYLARPDGDAERPAVIVLQEIFGVNTEIRRIADLLASAGYVAVAPNYFFRTHPDLNAPYSPEGRETGIAAASAVRVAGLLADVRSTAAWLAAQPFVRAGAVGAWGFCIGGSVAFLSATLPEVKAAACFYGGQIAGPWRSGEPGALSLASELRAPLLLAFGGKDGSIPRDAIERIAEALTAQAVTFELKVYPEADHGFFRGGGLNRESADAADAWESVQAFFREHLA